MTAPSLYDTVTGLPTRDLFLDRLFMALRSAERTGESTAVVLVHVRCDEIPLDTPEGEIDADTAEVLRAIGERLTGAVRAFDSVARMEHSTFAIIFPGSMDEDRLQMLSRRILFELSPPVQLGLRQFFLSARLGGTTADAGFDDADTLLAQAGAALDQAERQDEDLFIFFHAPDALEQPSS